MLSNLASTLSKRASMLSNLASTLSKRPSILSKRRSSFPNCKSIRTAKLRMSPRVEGSFQSETRSAVTCCSISLWALSFSSFSMTAPSVVEFMPECVRRTCQCAVDCFTKLAVAVKYPLILEFDGCSSVVHLSLGRFAENCNHRDSCNEVDKTVHDPCNVHFFHVNQIE